jgi:cytochrome c
VLGRKAGGVAGYAYSPALKASTLVWDERNLAAFIRDSEAVVPGNKMRFMNFMSEQQASDIVAYLATQGSREGR